MPKTKTTKTTVSAMPIIALLALALISFPKFAFAQNFSQANELLLLSKLEQYIRDSSHLINKAQAMQRDDARYKFRYESLRQDLSEIAESIRRHIVRNQHDQTPRAILPLVKDY